MSEFEKDLRYVKGLFSKIYHPDDLSNARRRKVEFINKYSILISHTDKRFNEIQVELSQLELEATKRITSAYYFR